MIRVAVLLAGACLAAAPAAAADWRYCLAPSASTHHVFLTPTFLSLQDLRTVEDGFAIALRDIGAGFDTVQCPRADSEGRIDEMRRWAERYNLQNGMTAETVEWSPGAAVAQLRGTR